jgi:hypothetical protein
MKIISVGLLELVTAVLECFLEKTPLSPLGVKKHGIENHFDWNSFVGALQLLYLLALTLNKPTIK